MLNRPLLCLLLLTLLAGLLRYLMAGWYLHLNQDAAYLFLPCAHALAAGEWQLGLDHSVPTGFLFLHAIWSLLPTEDPEFHARVLTALCGTACVPAVYLTARCFMTPSYALLAAAMMAVSGKSVEYSGRVSSEVPYALALIVAAWLGLLAIRRARWHASVWAGLGIGVAYLIRPEGMALLPVTLLGILLQRQKQKHVWWRAGLVMVSFLIGAMPMIWVNHHATGRLSLSNKGGISLERHERGAELALTDGNRITMLRYNLSREGYRPFGITQQFFADPVGFVTRSVGRAAVFIGRFLPRVMGAASTAGVLLLLAGLWIWRHRPLPWQGSLRLYIGGNVLIYIAALSLFFISDRFVLPLVPLLSILAAAGWAALLAQRSPTERATRVATGLLLLLLVFDLGHSVSKLDKYDGWNLGWRSAPQRVLGREIQRHFPAERVLSPGGELAYQMGATAVIFPNDRYANFIEYCQHQNVDLIAYAAAIDTNGETDREALRANDQVHRYITEWPSEPRELEDLGRIQIETAEGPVAAQVWRVRKE